MCKKEILSENQNVIKQIALLILFFKPDKYFNISNSAVPLNVMNLWSTSKRGSTIIQLHSSIIAEEAPSIQCEALLHSFSLVDAEMFREVVTALKSSTCTLDPIPTSLKKNKKFNPMSEEIHMIFKHSVQQSVSSNDRLFKNKQKKTNNVCIHLIYCNRL